MELSILAIDSDVANYNRLKLEWAKRGVLFHNESTVRGAIARLEKETFFFLCINGDSVNYWPQISLLREIARCPIFILSTTVTTRNLITAYQNGIDMYWFWRDEEVCAQIAMSIAERYHARDNQNQKYPKAMVLGELTVIPSNRQVLVNDIEILLSKTEFDILMYLIINRGNVLTYQQICRRIGLGEYDETSPDSLFSIVKRMRCKIRKTECLYEYIVNVRGIGYRFPAVFITTV